MIKFEFKNINYQKFHFTKIIIILLIGLISGLSCSKKTDENVDDIWSDNLGTMNLDEAKLKCKNQGMRLPTIEELKSLQRTGEISNWSKDGNTYWSSTPGDSENFYGIDVVIGPDFFNSNASLNVRCHKL